MSQKRVKNPIHPGEILLAEFLEPLQMTQTTFAKKLDWKTTRLNHFIKGRTGVTKNSAISLSKELKNSSKLWLNL